MSDDAPAAGTPIIRRKKFSPDAATTDERSPRNGYGWCRWLQVVLAFSGIGSIILGVIALVMAAGAAVNESADAAFFIASAGFGMITSGFVQFAMTELLGGIVAFLTKHDCYP